MNRIGKFLVFFATCIFFSTIIYSYTVDAVLPKIEYSNKIKFQLAFLNYDDVLVVAFKETKASVHTLNKYELKKTNFLNDIFLELPYDFEPSLYVLFGESRPVNFAISNIYINGKLVENKRIVEQLKKIGYRVILKDSVVYAQHQDNINVSGINLYDVSDSFIHMSRDEILEYGSQDDNLKLIYFIAIAVAFAFILHFVINRFSELSIKFIFMYSIVLYCLLFIAAYEELYNNLKSVNFVHFFLYLKNNLAIIFLPILVVMVSSSFKKVYNKIIFCLLTFLFLFFIGIDHFIQSVFGTRFLYNYINKFGGNISDGFPFLVNYVSNFSGLFYVLALFVVLGLFLIVPPKFCKTITNTGLLIILFISSVFISFCFNDNDSRNYFNVFQVNANGLFTEGDFARPYDKQIIYGYKQLDYKEKKGLNQRKNIILVLVESLGCNITYLCGNDENFSPYTQELAKNNIWFPNYYSNAYHTNGAIFAITTGFPFVPGKNFEKTPFDADFYKYDLINKFKENGYMTAYFTPAPLVLDKDKQLAVSKYDYISSCSDKFYDNVSKNGVFFSASDENLFSKIENDVKNAQNPFFFMTTTISTHTPYIVPWGKHRIDTAFAYSDMVLKKFIGNLEKINYFDNGIVIVTGDHIGWGNDNLTKETRDVLKIEQNKVPLIIINGHDHGVVIDDVSFSHTSLGILLEYLMLPNYYQNKFQINPLVDHNKNEHIINYDQHRLNYVAIKYGNKEDSILLDGDYSRFLSTTFTESEMKEILDYLSWLRK